MKKLIIVGASGFGREVEQYIADINFESPTWEIIGYIDDNLNALEGLSHKYIVIDTIKDHQPLKETYYVLALASPSLKEKIANQLIQRGAKFATIIHPTARISPYAKIGEGCIITPFSNVNTETTVGKFVAILSSGIGHDASVGDYSTLSGHVSINGHVSVGYKVFIGCGVVVAPSKRIGDCATVGIGSVVISNVKAQTTVFGNPAKKVVF